MPTIRKLPSGSFQSIVRLKNLEPQSATFKTKTKAKEWAKHIESATELARKLAGDRVLSLEEALQVQKTGKLPSCLSPSFEDWVDEYLHTTEIADNSAIGRVKFWRKCFGEILLTEITPEDIDNQLLALSEKVTGSTVNRYKSNLSSVFNAFNRHPKYKKLKHPNPVRSEFVSSFRENPPKERFLSPAEQEGLLKAARASHWDRLYLLVLMALTTGARRGELLKLTWSDIDFTNGKARLRTTKNGSPRYLPLLPDVIQELVKFVGDDNHLLFPSTVDSERPFDFKKALRKAMEEAGLEDVRFHDLRHTVASNMVANGRTLFETGTLLGHKQASTTMRYAHLEHDHTAQMATDVWEAIHGRH